MHRAAVVQQRAPGDEAGPLGAARSSGAWRRGGGGASSPLRRRPGGEGAGAEGEGKGPPGASSGLLLKERRCGRRWRGWAVALPVPEAARSLTCPRAGPGAAASGAAAAADSNGGGRRAAVTSAPSARGARRERTGRGAGERRAGRRRLVRLRGSAEGAEGGEGAHGGHGGRGGYGRLSARHSSVLCPPPATALPLRPPQRCPAARHRAARPAEREVEGTDRR